MNLIQDGVLFLCAQDGYTPLYWAVKLGGLKTCQELLSHKAPVNVQTKVPMSQIKLFHRPVLTELIYHRCNP